MRTMPINILFVSLFLLLSPAIQAADTAINTHINLITLLPNGTAANSAEAYASNAKLCTHAVTVCAREMQPLGVPIGGSFTVRIDDHFSATYECIMLDGKPRWAPTAQQGGCVEQPVILLPAKYDADDPWNIG